MKKIQAIDFFSGAGGLTKGLELAGINVFAGIDFEKSCKDTYEKNNDAIFINKNITNITVKEIKNLFKENVSKGDYTMLAGCAPCQPYSMINTRKKQNDDRKTLLDEFRRIINGVKPHFVLMENVSRLNQENPYFFNFIVMLQKNGYHFEYKVLNAKDFGVAQNRKRLFLIACRIKGVRLSFDNIQKQSPITLRDVIYNLESIEHDRPSEKDTLHRSKKLNEINLRRIKSTPLNGGLRTNWSDDLKLPCHSKKEIFCDNYGRLAWDKISSTITTKFNQYYSGRFGHPEQDRALSLREGALLQSFPKDYEFYGTDSQIAKQIGNAVPVNLSKAVGEIFTSAIY
ncbi:DNA cytosine methyltransferase [Helicobacter cappadocius]|uniref:DNA (cytosine-5-)-methyltransferase n=1 Tax=Helicobacter cappadocius TaxID=3063998 RepID=A0AA90PJU5_9HELI|nr:MULTISPECIES: DNA cytosine methyltransferase [unclassified Helicobacter]MDO7253059.1 DNA cytosine methyltransferase [Helicobacter sp. faydin-H75]MDP2538815.1 DNA cytosine methyltransferase [Helicobacter sp. faydin-H76]